MCSIHPFVKFVLEGTEVFLPPKKELNNGCPDCLIYFYTTIEQTLIGFPLRTIEVLSEYLCHTTLLNNQYQYDPIPHYHPNHSYLSGVICENRFRLKTMCEWVTYAHKIAVACNVEPFYQERMMDRCFKLSGIEPSDYMFVFARAAKITIDKQLEEWLGSKERIYNAYVHGLSAINEIEKSGRTKVWFPSYRAVAEKYIKAVHLPMLLEDVPLIKDLIGLINDYTV
jgi:hypothetical protein